MSLTSVQKSDDPRIQTFELDQVGFPTTADIAAHWGLRLAAPLEPIPAATTVVLRSGPYVVRSERRSVKSVLWEHDLLGFLAADVPEVVAPIPARDGTTFLARGRSVVSVFPYVEGRHMSRTGARVRVQLPQLLGRIHARGPVRASDRLDQRECLGSLHRLELVGDPEHRSNARRRASARARARRAGQRGRPRRSGCLAPRRACALAA